MSSSDSGLCDFSNDIYGKVQIICPNYVHNLLWNSGVDQSDLT